MVGCWKDFIKSSRLNFTFRCKGLNKFIRREDPVELVKFMFFWM